MAFYQILYWKDIPTQVKSWDDFDEVKIELDPRFMIKVDKVAQSTGVTETDDYLAQWNWSDEKEKDGSVEEVAESIKQEIESKHL